MPPPLQSQQKACGFYLLCGVVQVHPTLGTVLSQREREPRSPWVQGPAPLCPGFMVTHLFPNDKFTLASSVPVAI